MSDDYKKYFLEVAFEQSPKELKSHLVNLVESIYLHQNNRAQANVEYLNPDSVYLFIRSLTDGRNLSFIGKEKILGQSEPYLLDDYKSFKKSNVNYGYFLSTTDYYVSLVGISGVELMVLDVDALTRSNYKVNVKNPMFKPKTIIVANSQSEFKKDLEKLLNELPEKLKNEKMKELNLRQSYRSDYNCC